jgi:hypothetical protein
MNLSTVREVEGYSVISIRDFLKKTMERYDNGISDIANHFAVNDYRAALLFIALLCDGYVQVLRHPSALGGLQWGVTSLGRRLANARATKGLKRTTANHLLESLVSRASVANAKKEFAYYITKLVVFGSYLSDKQTISDLDIAVEIQSRFASNEDHLIASRQRIDGAVRNGKRFQNYPTALLWPRNEIFTYLRGVSKSIDIKETSDGVFELPTTVFKIVYQYDPEQGVNLV